MFDELHKSDKNYVSNIKKYIDTVCNNIISNIKQNKKKNLYFVIPYIDFLKTYKSIILIFLLALIYFYTNYVNALLFSFLLFDSIILSMLVLHNQSVNIISRRLAKNVIALVILYTNFSGYIFTLLIVLFFYNEVSKFTNKIIIKIIENIINFLSFNIPFLKYIYPSLKLIDYNKSIDSTETNEEIYNNKTTSDDTSDPIKFIQKYTKQNKKNKKDTKNKKNDLSKNNMIIDDLNSLSDDSTPLSS
jgi:hypothetical protein